MDKFYKLFSDQQRLSVMHSEFLQFRSPDQIKRVAIDRCDRYRENTWFCLRTGFLGVGLGRIWVDGETTLTK